MTPRAHIVPIDPAPTEDVGQRAAALLDTYAAQYRRRRHTALMRLGSNLQWLEACRMCETWDDATLGKMIDIFLTSTDDWIENTGRTWATFYARAQWCADRLAQWEAGRQRP